jgi:hypothetical protein
MPAKLIQYWNIRHGCHDDFDSFFTRQFIPQINDTGLMQIVASWHTASGEGPYFLVEGVSATLEDVESLVMGPVFGKLRQELFRLVSDYRSKLMMPRNFAETEPVEVEQGFKFTQHFNINAADIYAFDSFFQEAYVPHLKERGIDLVGEWNVVVGATPYVSIETRAKALEIFGELLENPDCRRMTRDLLNMVSCYGCKILVPSGHLNV